MGDIQHALDTVEVQQLTIGFAPRHSEWNCVRGDAERTAVDTTPLTLVAIASSTRPCASQTGRSFFITFHLPDSVSTQISVYFQ